jgi:hypothetical protein
VLEIYRMSIAKMNTMTEKKTSELSIPTTPNGPTRPPAPGIPFWTCRTTISSESSLSVSPIPKYSAIFQLPLEDNKMAPMVPADPPVTYFPTLQCYTEHELLDSAEILRLSRVRDPREGVKLHSREWLSFSECIWSIKVS